MKRVGVLRGGKGKNYESSLQKGGEIILYITENLADKYKPIDILIDRNDIWHLNGLPINPSDLIHKVDIVWNTADPSEATILGSFSIPHVSAGFFSSSLESSREMLREHMAKTGVKMPRHIILPLYQKDFDGPRERYAIKKAKEIHEKFGAPWIVKSFNEDSNGISIHLAKTFGELAQAIEDGLNHRGSILVEEFIAGKVASVHSVPGFRGGDVYTFPCLPAGGAFGNFSEAEKGKLASLAEDFHNHTGAKHYLKSDFVITPRGKIYLLNIKSTPDLRSGSHFSEACQSVGAKMHHVVEHILENILSPVKSVEISKC